MRIAAFLLLPLAACETVHVTYSTDYDMCHMFGDRLDACRGARLLCWAADADGLSFRCVEDRIEKKTSEQTVSLWPDSAPARGPVGSVIVILPPDASPALRARSEELMDDLTRASPRAGRHVVTADSSWQDVTDGRALAGRLLDLQRQAQEWRQTSSDDGIFVTNEVLSRLTPHVIVIPLEGDADRQLVLQGIRRKSPLTLGWEAETQTFLPCDAIRQLPPLTSGEESRLMVFEIVVSDAAGAAARARAMRLVEDLLARGHTSVYLRTVACPEIAQGVIEPGTLEPPYIADWQLDGQTAE